MFGELGFQRTQILFGPPILRQLNEIKRDREKYENVNRAALVQNKLQHQPDEDEQASSVPEHFDSVVQVGNLRKRKLTICATRTNAL